MNTSFVFFGRTRRALLVLGAALWCSGLVVATLVGSPWGVVVLMVSGLPGGVVALTAAAPLFLPADDRRGGDRA